MSDLSHELRNYDANGNAVGAHAMMSRTADILDVVVTALQLALADKFSSSATKAVATQALIAAGAPLAEKPVRHFTIAGGAR